MADNVLQSVLAKCRNALLGGIPILYIKTDSDIFIQKLITSETNPLVVLLSSGGRRATGSQMKLNSNRPIYELSGEQDKQLQYCANYKNSEPSERGTGLYDELYVKKLKEIMRPCIWAFKMPESPEEQNRIHKNLEQYVAAHEDTGHPQYQALQSSVVLVYSSQVSMSSALKPYTEFIDVEYPDEEEIRSLIKSESYGDPCLTENERYLSALCTDFLGFTSEEITMTMKRILASTSLENSERVEKIIRERKSQKLEGGLLEQCGTDSDIGGMDNFRPWLTAQVQPLKNANAYMREVGTPPAKGVLLCGIPGCGKSEAARFTAKTLGLPLLKMDIGSLMNKFVGSSEQRMRDALKMAEAMAPCVLWIDELEKGFSGAGADGDSSHFKRMFGYMLGWMQENKKPCFIFATANDIGGLPKEFFRSGRFDALYAVYLPTADECADIFKACMEKAEKNMARARHIARSEVKLFSEACYSDKMLREIVNETLVRPDGRPRAIIGSDIQKIVNIALRTFSGKITADGAGISKDDWNNTVRAAIADEKFRAYGDSEENMDSIAVGYCRMLRKGFIPTSKKVLFDDKDYHMENLAKYERLKRMDIFSLGDSERKEYEENLAKCEILQNRGQNFDNAYDYAVYHYLRPRINEMALLVEHRERTRLIG